jgi:cell division protein FtsB
MRKTILLLALLATFARADESFDEAQAKLQAKAAARATSQPAMVEMDKLRRENAALKAENQKLVAQIDGLQKKLAATTAPTKGAAAAAVNKDWKDSLKIGMTEAEAKEIFKTVPNPSDTVAEKVVSQTADGKTIQWIQSTPLYSDGGPPIETGNFSFKHQPPAQRLSGYKRITICTLEFRDGKLERIDF